MDEILWKKIKALFYDALDLPQDQRQEFVAKKSASDERLFNDVMQMLSAEHSKGDNIAIAVSLQVDKLIDEKYAISIGDKIGSYQIHSQIGQGGMGRVFLANRIDDEYQHQVAIKVIEEQTVSAQAIQRFQTERQILADLSHRNIAGLIDGGTTEKGLPFIVMEYVEGKPIIEFCESNQLDLKSRLKLFIQVCSAIEYAHQNFVVHRDIKPNNILVTDNGEVKLLDFGIAKLLVDDNKQENLQLTHQDIRLLTPTSASPEQISGQTITTRTDVYGLGALLYHLLTGEPLFNLESEIRIELEKAICDKIPQRPSEVVASKDSQLKTKQLIGDIDTMTLKALQKDPQRRYSSASQFSEDIDNYLNNYPILARPDSLLYRMKKLVRRNRSTVIVASVAVIAFIGSITFYTIQLAKQRDVATIERQKAEEVADFVLGLFEVSDPSHSKGEKITAKNLLDAGAIRVESELANQPIVQQMMRRVLGEVYYKLGDVDQAEKLLNNALTQQRKIFGENNLEVATTKLALASLYQYSGDFQRAEPLFQEVLNIRKYLLGGEHFDVVESLDSLGFFEQTRGDYQTALTYYQRAYSMGKRLTNKDNESLAETMKNLGTLYQILDRVDEAETFFNDALAMQKRLYNGGPHPQIDNTKRELAGIYRNSRRFEKAESLYLELIESREKMLGPDHVELAHAWNSYSTLLSRMGKAEESNHANNAFIEIMKRAFDDPHPSLGAAYNNRANYLRRSGDLDGALENYQLAIKMQDEVGIPEHHSNRSFPLSGIAKVYLEQKEFVKARDLFINILELRKQSFSATHKSVLDAKGNLASALMGLKDYDKASDLLNETYQNFLASRGSDDPRTEIAAWRLLQLYTKSGEVERAEQYRAKFKKDGVDP